MTPGVPGVRYRIHAVTVGSDIVNLKVLDTTDSRFDNRPSFHLSHFCLDGPLNGQILTLAKG